MSTSIDERVVSMRFNNKEFEENASESMRTLDKLHEKLQFKDAGQGLEAISVAANKVSLSGLTNEVGVVEAKFSAMSIAAATAISNITNSALNAGKRLVNSLSLDQITAGFSKYEQKTQAVQTIMNATGKSVDEVSDRLDKLMWYTDETSYSFIDMVSNIGKFTNYSVDLDVAITAMEGISNWAALVGANINQASIAMYNLSQAIGLGVVRLQDWRSIENANMADTQFKQIALEQAEALGMLTKVEDGLYKTTKGNEVSTKNFTEAMKDNWFTSEVLLKTLDEYGKYADVLYESVEKTGYSASTLMDISDEYIAGTLTNIESYAEAAGMTLEEFTDELEKLGDESLELSKKAFQSGQVARTWSDAINSVKDAVSSGWMVTFEHIFGNFNEAKELWTKVSEELYNVFAESGNERNQILRQWKVEFKGRDKLLEGVGAAWENFLQILNTVKKAFREIFPKKTAEDLYKITEGFTVFIQSLKLSDKAAYTLKVTIKTLLIPFKLLSETAKLAGLILLVLTQKVFKLVDSFMALLATNDGIKDLLAKLIGFERAKRIVDAFDTAVDRISSAFEVLKGKIKSVWKTLDVSGNIGKAFSTLLDILLKIGGKALDAIITGFEILVNADYSKVIEYVKSGLSGIMDGLKGIRDFIKPVTDGVKNLFKNFADKTPSEILDYIHSEFIRIKTQFNNFKKSFTLSGLFNNLKKQVSNVGSAFEGLADSVMKFISKISPAKILVFSFGTALTGMMFSIMDATKGFANAMNGVGGVLGAVKDRIKPDKFARLSKALLMLAGALAILSLVDATKLRQATESMVALMAALTIMSAAMAAVQKFLLSGENAAEKFALVGQSMLMMGGAVLALSAALFILTKVKIDNLLGSLVLLAALFAALVVVAKVMAKSTPQLTKGSLFLLAFATSITLIINALNKLGASDMSGIKKNLDNILIIIGAMILIAKAAKNVSFGGALGIALLCADIWLLIKTLKGLDNIKTKDITKNLLAFIEIVGLIAVLGKATSKAGEHAAQMGVAILLVSASMLVLGKAIEYIGSFNTKVAIQGTIIVGLMLLLIKKFAVMAAFMDENSKSFDKFGTGVLKLSASMLVLGLAIKYIGNIPLKAAIQGTIVVGAVFAMLLGMMKFSKSIDKVTVPITAMSVAIGILTAALAVLTLIPFNELMGAAAALSVVLIAFGVSMKLISSMKLTNALGSILVLGAVLVALSLALSVLSDVDANGILTKATALSEVMVALGVSVKLMNTMKRVKSLDNKMKTLAAIIGASTLALWALSEIPGDGQDLILKATALGEVMIALSASLKIVEGITVDDKSLKPKITSIIAVLGASTLALWALSAIPGDGQDLILKATALGEVMIALSASLKIMNSFNVGDDKKTIVGTIATIIAILGGVTLMFYALQKVDAKNMLVQSVALSAALLAFSGATWILSKIKIPSFVGFLEAVGGFLLVIAAIGGVCYLLGNLADDGNTLKLIQDGGKIFSELGIVIGEFFGNLIGSFVGSAIGSGLIAIADSLSTFMDKMQPFFDGAANIDDRMVDGVTKLAKMMLVMTGAELVDTLVGWIPGSKDLIDFGAELCLFAPFLVEFSNIIGDVDSKAVSQAANAAKGLAEFADALPNEGGLWQKIAGEGSLKKFGEGLAEFAPAFVEFAENLKGLDTSVVETSAAAAKSLAAFANAIPSSGGRWQEFFGEKNIAEFGDGLKTFGEKFVEYYHSVEEITDFDIVERSAAIAKSLAAFADDIPASGGDWQKFIGEKDMKKFGENLVEFGKSFLQYYMWVLPIKMDVVEASSAAAQSLTELNDGLARTGGDWQAFIGEKDMAGFGKKLAQFGMYFYLYYQSIKNIKSAVVQNSAAAAESLAAFQEKLPDSGWFDKIFGSKKMDEFGEDLAKFGEGFYNFYEAIKDANVDNIVKAVDVMTDLATMAGIVADTDTYQLTTFSDRLRLLATQGITAFTNTFVEAEEDFTSVGSTLVGYVSNGIVVNLPSIGSSIKSIVDGILSAITQNLEPVREGALTLGQTFVDGIMASKDNFSKTGEYMIDGLVEGLNRSKPKLIKTMGEISAEALATANNTLGVHSPSTEFYKTATFVVQGFVNGINDNAVSAISTITSFSNQLINSSKGTFGIDNAKPSERFNEIGSYIVAGLQNGIKNDTPKAMETAVRMGKNLMTAFKDYFIIKSPSVRAEKEIGNYIIQGIAEGITNDMSAEEAAAQKASNIVSAFQQAFDSLSLNLDIFKGEYDLWSGLYGDTAGQDEARRQKNDYLTKTLNGQAERVRLAEGEYKLMVEEFGETSDKALESYKKFLDEQNTMVSYAKEMAEFRNETMASFGDIASSRAEAHRIRYDQIFNEEAAKYEDEEAGRIAGKAAADKWQEETLAFMKQLDEEYGPDDFSNIWGPTSVADIYKEFMGDIQVNVTKSVEQGVVTGSQNAAYGSDVPQAGADAGKQYGEGFKEGLQEKLLSGDYGGLMQMLEQAGIYVTNGFTGAIQKAKEIIFGVVDENIVEPTKEAMEEGMDMNSPSKVMYEYGQYVIEGFELGIANSAQGPVQILRDVIDQMIKALEPYMSSVKIVGTEVINQFQYGIESGIQFAVPELQLALERAFLNTLGVMFYQIGQNLGFAITQGFTESIYSFMAALGTAITDLSSMASVATSAVRIEFEAAAEAIRSLGEAVATSMAAMLKSIESDAAAAMNTIGSATSQLNDLYQQLSDLSNTGVNIPITLDTSGISNQISGISGEMSSALANNISRSTSGNGGVSANANMVVNNYTVNQNNTYNGKTQSEASAYRDTKSAMSSFEAARP